MSTKSKFRYIPSLDNPKFKFSRRDYLFSNNHDDRVIPFSGFNTQKEAGKNIAEDFCYTR